MLSVFSDVTTNTISPPMLLTSVANLAPKPGIFVPLMISIVLLSETIVGSKKAEETICCFFKSSVLTSTDFSITEFWGTVFAKTANLKTSINVGFSSKLNELKKTLNKSEAMPELFISKLFLFTTASTGRLSK